jgi:hypothetical protein
MRTLPTKTVRVLMLLTGLVAAGLVWLPWGMPGATAATLPSPVELVAGQTPTLVQEWLVTTTSSCITAVSGRKAIELQNLGPNDIFCSLTSAAVLNKSRRIDKSGGSWALDVGDTIPVCCIAATANQVTGAATIVTQPR